MSVLFGLRYTLQFKMKRRPCGGRLSRSLTSELKDSLRSSQATRAKITFLSSNFAPISIAKSRENQIIDTDKRRMPHHMHASANRSCLQRKRTTQTQQELNKPVPASPSLANSRQKSKRLLEHEQHNSAILCRNHVYLSAYASFHRCLMRLAI